MEAEMDDFLEPGSLTWVQAMELRRLLPEGTPIGHLSRYEAAGLIQLHTPTAAWRGEPASDRQKKFLQRHRLWREGLTKGEASELISKAIEHSKKFPFSVAMMREV
jgi:hypothetical protein